jgi:hypothetical protein
MPLAAMQARPEDWRRQLMRGVLSGKVLEVSAVLMLETPVDGRNLEVGVGVGGCVGVGVWRCVGVGVGVGVWVCGCGCVWVCGGGGV